MPFPCRAPHLDVDFAPACVLMWPHPGRLHEDGTGEQWEMSPWPDPEPKERVECVRQQRAVDDDWVGFMAGKSLNRVVSALPEVDADPDTAFELGRIAGYDEAMREASQGEPSDAEHQVAWAEYRKDLQPNVAHLHREAIAFREGWRAALRAAGVHDG